MPCDLGITVSAIYKSQKVPKNVYHKRLNLQDWKNPYQIGVRHISFILTLVVNQCQS